MQLYYTTTSGYNGEQPNPERSLGGFKSSTPVSNDDFSNIFDEISLMTMKSGRDEYRAIVLKNEFDTPCTNITVKISRQEGAICSYKMAVGAMNVVNKYNQKSMENVLFPNNKPFRAQFIDMTEEAVLEVGDLNPGDEIGLWLCRHVDVDAAKQQYNDVCEPDPSDPTGRRYKPVTHPQQESIDMIVDWV